MTAQRVVGTDAARQAALQMRQLLDGSMNAHIQALLVQGRALSNPRVWDGPQAAAFRQGQWPAVERSLVLVQQRLPALQARAESVVEDIIHHGSTGAIGAAAISVGSLAALSALILEARAADRLRPAIEAGLAARTWIGSKGAANEAALLDLLRRNGVPGYDLNLLRPGNRAANFPLLDAASKDGFFSAKAYSGPSALDRYASDFQKLVWSEGAPTKLADAAGYIDANRAALQAADAWPRGLPTGASVDAIKAFITDNAKLAIPNDQIAALSRLIRARALDVPEAYGLPAAPTTAEVDGLLSRIVGSGIKSVAVEKISDYYAALRGAVPALDRATPFITRALQSPAFKVLKGAGLGLAAAGDIFTLASPSPDALGGPTTERVAAGLNLAAVGVGLAGPLLAANAATDWIPGVGEVTMGLTAAYFIGDLAWQNRQWIENTGSHVLHAAGQAISSAWHSVTSWL